MNKLFEKPRRRRVVIYLDEPQEAALKRYAEQADTSISQVARTLLDAGIRWAERERRAS